MSSKRKKKFQEIGLLILTFFLFVFIVVGLAFTKSEAFQKMRNPTSSSTQQVVVKQTEDSSSSVEQPPSSEAPSAEQKTEIEWVKQDAPVQLPILMYHAIHTMAPEEEASANLIVDPSVFETHMEALSEAGYYPVSPEEAYKILTENVLPKDKKPVWLTFDDSIWDFYDIAYPILKKYQFQATNNVITGTVGNEANLSLEEMKEMKENGISLQAHTVNHPTLEYVDTATQTSEIVDSKSYLDTNLNQETISLAYPSGSYSSDTLAIMESANLKLGTTTNEGLASADNGLLTLNRVRILPTTTPEILLQTIATP